MARIIMTSTIVSPELLIFFSILLTPDKQSSHCLERQFQSMPMILL
jgi:hypothetical protein